MKALLDRVLQVIILLAATGVTLYFELDKAVQPWIGSLANHVDEKTVIPVISGLIYLVLFLIIAAFLKLPPIRRRIDKKYAYSGKYISLPKDADVLSVFEITSGFFDTRYQLVGHSYSVSGLRATGGWNSTLLDMKPDGNLTYIYSGYEIDQQTGTKKFQGHGYAHITLLGQELDAGTGHWVDDDPSLTRRNSTYVKLTRANKKRIKQDQSRFTRLLWLLVWPHISIVKAFGQMSPTVKSQAPFARPTT